MALLHLAVGLLAAAAPTSALTFNVPASAPTNASAQLAEAPVGLSLEFFTFPAYMNDVEATKTCLQNLKELTGTWPPIRIGGTTQCASSSSRPFKSALSGLMLFQRPCNI